MLIDPSGALPARAESDRYCRMGAVSFHGSYRAAGPEAASGADPLSVRVREGLAGLDARAGDELVTGRRVCLCY